MIENKQRGGLINPIVDVVAIGKIANEALEIEMYKNRFTTIANFGNLFTDEIVSEIMASKPNLLEQLDHDPFHKVKMYKKIIFNFVSSKVKHLCRVSNVENASLSRHKNKKMYIFNHE